MPIYDDRGPTDVELSSIRARGAILALRLIPVNHASARIPGHISLRTPVFQHRRVSLDIQEGTITMIMLTTARNGMNGT